MLTLKESMELAGANLLHTLSPAYTWMPLWNLKIVRETMQARCKMDYPAHNIGRWWDAMLDHRQFRPALMNSLKLSSSVGLISAVIGMTVLATAPRAATRPLNEVPSA